MRANGHMITYDDANYMIEFEGFTLLGTLDNGDRVLTRSVIDTYMNADSSLYSAYASNRLVPYQLLAPAVDCTLPIISVETYTYGANPTVPGSPTFSLSTTSSYRVNFIGSTDDDGIQRYEVSKNGGAAISTGLNLFYNNTDSSGITATWKVRAVDNLNNVSAWSSISSWATVPAAPVLTFDGKLTDAINLSRNSVVGGSSYWLTTSGQVTDYYTVTGTPFTISNLSSGTYNFRIQAKGAFGLLSAYSNTITETIAVSIIMPSYKSQAAVVNSTGIIINVLIPFGINVNDTLIMRVQVNGNIELVTPTGWTRMSVWNTVNGYIFYTYLRRADGTEGGSVAIQNQNSSSFTSLGHMILFQDVNTVGLSTEGSAQNTSTGSGLSLLNTNATQGAQRLAVGFGAHASSNLNSTTLNGWTQRSNSGNGNIGIILCHTYPMPTAGTTTPAGSLSFNASTYGDEIMFYLIPNP